MTIPDLSVGRLAVCASLLLVVASTSWYLELGLEGQLVVAASRCALQLTILCAFLLEPMFASNRPSFIFLYLFAIMMLASREASARLKYEYASVRSHFAASFAVGAGGVVAFAVAVVLQLDPWWDARYLIPVAGTLLGNNLTATAIGADALLCDVAENTDKVELRLCRGATWREALLPSMRNAIAKALAPTLNSMAIMGLVMLPGMMTGQILGGQSPLEAGVYQILIMYLVCVSGCVASSAVVAFAARAIVDPPNHALRRERVREVDKDNRPNKDILLAAIVGLRDFLQALFTFLCSSCPSFGAGSGGGVQGGGDNGKKNGKKKTTTTNERTSLVGKGGDEDEGERTLTTKIPLLPAAKFEAVVVAGPAGSAPQRPLGPAVLRADGVVVARTGLRCSFTVSKETRLAVTGATGSGKTSLLKVLCRLDEPESGVLRLMDTNKTPEGGDPPRRDDVPAWRARVLYVAQDRPTLPGCPQDLYDTVRRYRAQRRRGDKFPDDAPARIAENWDLHPSKFTQAWFSLSGGEAQRANLAIALALKPDVLLLDEFTSALDDKTTAAVERDVLNAGAGVVLVTHSPDQANRLCHTHLRIHARRDRDRSATLPLLV